MFLPLQDDTPRLRPPVATSCLVLTSVLVFLYQLSLTPFESMQLMRAAGVVPWELRHLTDLVGHGHPRDLVPPPATIFTSLFIHGDPLHLVGNMWFLWVFGSRLEGYMGRLRYLAFYFTAGAVAAALQVAADPEATMPMIGASGAIAGVLGGYALRFPHARVRCLAFFVFFVTFVELPAALLLGVWFLAQFLSAGGGAPGVAWSAHIGGFLAGLALARLFAARRRRVVYHAAWCPPPLHSPSVRGNW
jgi:membrane associated rhomboid family serine protease